MAVLHICCLLVYYFKKLHSVEKKHGTITIAYGPIFYVWYDCELVDSAITSVSLSLVY